MRRKKIPRASSEKNRFCRYKLNREVLGHYVVIVSEPLSIHHENTYIIQNFRELEFSTLRTLI